MTDPLARYTPGDAGVAWLVMNDPQRLNAYTEPMARAMEQSLQRFAADDAQRVLVLTGAGRAFSSGGNLRDSAAHDKAGERAFGHAMVMREGIHRVVLALHRLDKPTIAMINGPAVAGGLALACACDLRVASDRAVLGDTSGRVGLLPDEGGAWLWPRMIGLERALRMSWLHETYDAHEALRLGLVSEVVTHDELEPRVRALAEALAAKAPLAVRMVKQLMRRGGGQTLEEALGDAELAVLAVNDSEDAREGVEAFRERRSPRFRGR